MSAKDVAKVVWRWRGVAQQALEDYKVHRRYHDLPSSILYRFYEQEKLLWSNRIRATDYYSLGLADRQMPAETKRTYIGGYEAWRLFYPMNAKEFHELTDKKLMFNKVASEAGLPVTPVLALVSDRATDTQHPVLASKQALRDWLQDNQIADVVLKPVDGTKGWGVMSLGRRQPGQEAWARLPRAETIDFDEIWTHCSRYLYRGGVIIERRLRPHPVLATVMPDVLHTVRAVSYFTSEPAIVTAALRVGSGKAPADNLAQGGIVVPIDLRTGNCGRGSGVVNGLPRFIDEHPVTGTRITGMVLPDWDEVCNLVKRAAQAFSMQKSIGWDIGLTEQGPVLLEGNWCYDLAVNQIATRQGILAMPWVQVFNETGAYRHLGLGFANRPRTSGATRDGTLDTALP